MEVRQGLLANTKLYHCNDCICAACCLLQVIVVATGKHLTSATAFNFPRRKKIYQSQFDDLYYKLLCLEPALFYARVCCAQLRGIRFCFQIALVPTDSSRASLAAYEQPPRIPEP